MKTRSTPIYRVQTFPRTPEEGTKWVNHGLPFETFELAEAETYKLLEGVEPGYYDERLRVIEEVTIIETTQMLRINATFVGLQKVSH